MAAEEPDLPPLSAISYDANTGTFNNQSSRKRPRLGLHGNNATMAPPPPPSFNNSSDPAIFSSDDDPSLENYTQARRKRRYVGSWFRRFPAPAASDDDSTLGVGDADGYDVATDPAVLPLRRKRSFAKAISAAAPDEDAEGAEPSLPPQKKDRVLERRFDSGVWMGSDGTELDDVSDMLLTSDTDPACPLPLPTQHSAVTRLAHSEANILSPAEQQARRIIQTCLEEGKERIDLESLGLGLHPQDMSDVTVAPLADFVPCIVPPVVTRDVPFETREPHLQLYLSSNNMSSLPGSLFDIRSLSLLTVRGNEITSLPPAIERLKALHSLNVSMNFLRYLPSELFELITSSSTFQHLHLHPNPFVMPDLTDKPDACTSQCLPCSGPRALSADDSTASTQSDGNHSAAARRRAWLNLRNRDCSEGYVCYGRKSRFLGRLLARSPVQYRDGTGTIRSAFRLPPADQNTNSHDHDQQDGDNGRRVRNLIPTEDLSCSPCPPEPADGFAKPLLPRPNSTADSSTYQPSRVPTLLELALRTCYDAPQLNILPELLPDGAPAHLGMLLEQALRDRESSGNGASFGQFPGSQVHGSGVLPQRCTVCRRPMVVARTEWIEWWELARVCQVDESPETSGAEVDEGQPTISLQFDPMTTNEEEWPVPFLRRGCSWKCLPKRLGTHEDGMPREPRWGGSLDFPEGRKQQDKPKLKIFNEWSGDWLIRL